MQSHARTTTKFNTEEVNIYIMLSHNRERERSRQKADGRIQQN